MSTVKIPREFYRVSNKCRNDKYTIISCSNAKSDRARKNFRFEILNFSPKGIGISEKRCIEDCPYNGYIPNVHFALPFKPAEKNAIKASDTPNRRYEGQCLWRKQEGNGSQCLNAGVLLYNPESLNKPENALGIWEELLLKQFKSFNEAYSAKFFNILNDKFKPLKREEKATLIPYGKHYAFPLSKSGEIDDIEIKEVMSSLFALLTLRFYTSTKLKRFNDLQYTIGFINTVGELLSKMSGRKEYTFIPVAASKERSNNILDGDVFKFLHNLQEFYKESIMVNYLVPSTVGKVAKKVKRRYR